MKFATATGTGVKVEADKVPAVPLAKTGYAVTFDAAAASDQAIFAVAETHRVAMEASADPASYDYSGGWPKVYGE